MTFVVLNCPSCGRRTIMDEIGGRGFCMYCGADASEASLESLDQYSVSFLNTIVAETEEERAYVNEPWYPDMECAVDALQAGDFSGAAVSFREAIDGKDGQVVRAMQDAMAGELAMAVMGPIFAGTPYRGGVIEVASALVSDDDEDTDVSVLIESLYKAVCESKDVVRDADVVRSMVLSAYVLVGEFMVAESSASAQLAMLEDFDAQCDSFAGIVVDCEGGEDILTTMDLMCGAVSALYWGMDGVFSVADEGILATVENAWAESGRSPGHIAKDILDRVMVDGFEDSDASWEALKSDAKAYAETYMTSSA